MATLTENPRDLSFLLSESEGRRSRDEGTIATGNGVIKAGTVMGIIAASGKWAPHVNGAVDGTETAAGVLAYEADTTAADVQGVIVVRDAEVIGDQLVYDASVDTAAKKAAAEASLGTNHIIVR